MTSVRKRRHRNATPKWVTKEEKLAIRKLYLKAMELTKLTGVRYVVDHDYPLHGETICGLHVLKNLTDHDSGGKFEESQTSCLSHRIPLAFPLGS
jgi:hypothetical protein